MNIIVCVKQVADPEAPPSSFKIDAAGKTMVLPTDVPPVLDPYSQYAVEAALRLKDAHGGTVTALSLGTGFVKDVVRKPLAMGADELVLLDDEAFSGGDSFTTALALSSAVKKIGGYDLILCGRQSADRDAGQVGNGLAELLCLPLITLARKIEVSDGNIRVERVTANGYEVLQAASPLVITVSNEVGEPRYPTIRGIMTSKKKEPVTWQPADIGLDVSQVGAAGRRSQLVRLFQPERGVSCQFIAGETPEEAAIVLADRLRQEKLL
jgi:electron transfer flavoprotein beta subunit